MAKKDSGAVKKVLGLFYDFQDKTPAPEETKEETVAQAPPQINKEEAVIEVTPPPAAPATGEVDNEMKENLIRAIEEANITGYDYFEFKEALFNMEAIIPTEAERFKAAFAAVSAIVTSDHLIKTAQHYIGILKEKEEDFNKYVEHIRNERVAGNEQEAAKAQTEIEKKQEMIIQLNQEIAELQEKKKTAQQKAITENAKIQQVELNFKTTCGAISKKIQADVTKIETYLKPPKEKKVEVKDE